MSSAVISTPAAQSRFFVFDAEIGPEVCPLRGHRDLAEGLQSSPVNFIPSTTNQEKAKLLTSIVPASRLKVRPSPDVVSSGIVEIDALTGGLARGCLTEIVGPPSSGCTTLLVAALAAAIRRGEVCALVDASDALDPHSISGAEVELDRLLWVRCGEDAQKTKNSRSAFKFGRDGSGQDEHRLEQVLRITEWLIESGGFGLIALDLSDLPLQIVRRIPLTTWFRFRRAIEHTPTVLLAIERQSIAGSCSSLSIKLGAGNRMRIKEVETSEVSEPAHARLLTTVEITAEVMRSRMERKPALSVPTMFASKTAWAG